MFYAKDLSLQLFADDLNGSILIGYSTAFTSS